MFWHMQLYMSWCIRSFFFGFTFLNIIYFVKYFCTNILHRRSLYTFYSNLWIDFIIVFGLEQEIGSLITPMVLAHPRHPIRGRSKNKRRNLMMYFRLTTFSPGAKMGTWKSLRVQGFMIDPESIGVSRQLSLVATTATLWNYFYLHNS